MQCTAIRAWQSLRASARVHSSSSSRLRSCYAPRQSQLASTISNSKNTSVLCQAYGSQSTKVQTRAPRSMHSLQPQRHALSSSISSSSSRAYETCTAKLAAAKALVQVRAQPLLMSEEQQRVQDDHNQLDSDQSAAVQSKKQYCRVIAGEHHNNDYLYS